METIINGITYTSTTTGGATTVTYSNGSVVSPESHNDIVKEIVLSSIRLERDTLLTESDWRTNSDYPYPDKAEWITYRQELRDLPSTYDGTDIVLPTQPEP